MAYRVTEACTNCGSCESECPVSAISEKDNARYIDPETCIDCGACAAACPTSWAAPFIFLYDQTVSLSGFLLSQVIAFFYRSPQEPHRDSAIRSLEAHNRHEQLACLYG